MADREEEFKGYQNTRLERHKHIGVPNLALEMAERLVQAIQDPEWVPSMSQYLDVVEALGAAKFSAAHEDRRDLFECAEDHLVQIRALIVELDR